MIRILITGADSYIGTSFEKWLQQYSDRYGIDTIDVIGDSWRKQSFSGYDVVFHVAGIAHIKETKANVALYYRVNRDLAYEVAQKAKADNVRQFIFLSSMSVYGFMQGIITCNTIPDPKSNYGKSKLEAERKISMLHDHNFSVSILRPPMVYGKGCKGNFQSLKKLALKVHIFPNVNNSRSMIFIDNLCEFVRIIMENQIAGILFPQNSEYVCTSNLVSLISGQTVLVSGFNGIIKILSKQVKIISKVFGDLVYEKSMSNININYNVCNFSQSIQRSL